MPLPAGVDGVTVSSGTPLCLPDGTPVEGKLLFTAPDVVTVSGQDVLLGGTREARLVDGEFSITLAATDVTGMSPSGWTYTVTAVLSNAPSWIRHISLPKATPTVKLADVVVPDPVAGTFAVLTDGSALLAKAANLSDLTSASTARTNLGLGNSATRAVGTTAGTVAAGDDGRLSDARTPTVHAASHAAAGSDPVTLTQAQITGLVSALAALLPLAGGTITGALTIEGYTTLQGGQFNSDFAAFGDMQLIGTGKAYRFRRSGSNLDLEGAGVDMIVSVWSAGDFTGTQRSYDRYSSDATNVQHAGKREYVSALYGGAVHTIDPITGVASLGAKNGLTNIRLAGFKATAGAPTTGTWTSGDVILDSAGAWHLCTTGGTPGTWT